MAKSPSPQIAIKYKDLNTKRTRRTYHRGVFMVKSFALSLLVSMLLLVSMPFAESYSKKYVSDGWLEVTRTLEVSNDGHCPLLIGVSDACANSGANQIGTAFTLVTLSLKNIGPIDKSYVNIGESFSYVPPGATISFLPSPSQFDGRQAIWEIPELKREETKNVTYQFGATVSEAVIERIPDAAATAAPSTVMLFAPSKVPVNNTLTLSLKSMEGRPITGAKIVVDYPDGNRQTVRTDGTGTVSLMATHIGSYTYSAEGYKLYQIVSTIVYDKNALENDVPATAASAADAGILSGIVGALPIFAGIFAVTVVALIAYNFLSARRENDDESGPAPQLAEQQAKKLQIPFSTADYGNSTATKNESSVNYSQKFSFGTDVEHEKDLDDTTRSMVESRKRRMQENEPTPPVEHEEVPFEVKSAKRVEEDITGSRDSAEADGSERTVTDGEMDDELAELEKSARIAGEVAAQEKEVENMLTQLEGIRNKLRAGRGSGSEEVEVPRQPKPPMRAVAPARKIAAPISKAAASKAAASASRAAASASKAATKSAVKQKSRKK